MTRADNDHDSDAKNDQDPAQNSNLAADPTATAHPAGEDQAAENRENEPPG